MCVDFDHFLNIDVIVNCETDIVCYDAQQRVLSYI